MVKARVKKTIHRRHFAEFKAVGITRQTLHRAGIRSITAKTAEKLSGHDCGPGWAAPVRSLGDNDVLFVVKPDEPFIFGDGHTAKYLWPTGQPNRMYFPPGFEAVAENVEAPLVVTEGIKKVLRAVQDGHWAIGVHGVWNFTSKGEPVAGLSRVNWRRRSVTIAYDSDAAANESVRLAQFVLALELQRRGAVVRVAQIPAANDGSKLGLDDFIAREGKAGLGRVLDKAVSLVDYEVGRIENLPDAEQGSELALLLSHIARRCAAIETEAFLAAINSRLGVKRKVLDQQLREAKQHRPAEEAMKRPTPEALNRVRHCGAYKELERFQLISEAILKDLRRHGRLLNSDRGVYYIDDRQHKVFDVQESDFADHCNQCYATNASNREWKHLVKDILAATRVQEKRVVIREFAYFDREKGKLYVVCNDAEVWVLDGKRIRKQPNGTDDVFLRTPDFEPPRIDRRARASWTKDVLAYLSLDEGLGLEEGQAVLLLQVWLWSLFFDSMLPTRPILCLFGKKGSGKSCLLRLIGKALYGPGFEVNAFPRNEDNLETLMVNSRLVTLDNMDARTSDGVLDLIATAATGGEITRRVLYTTAEPRRFRLSCYLAVTSRTPHFRRDDIAERLLLLGTARLGKFEPEVAMQSKVLKARGSLWWSLLRELNRAVDRLTRSSHRQWTSRHRMADFASFGRTVLGPDRRRAWAEALAALEQSQKQFLLRDDRIATRLRDWVKRRGGRVRDVSASQIIRRAWYRSSDGVSPVELGRRLHDPEDPLRHWIDVTVRTRGGVSRYYLALTEAGRRRGG